MRLAEYVGVTQKTAWFMLHGIRKAFADVRPELFHGPVEIDETYVGGLVKNMHARKRRLLTWQELVEGGDAYPVGLGSSLIWRVGSRLE